MRSNILIAQDGDSLDEVIWREAQLGPEALPAIFAANPGICEELTLSAGQRVALPAQSDFSIAAPSPKNTVALWD